MSIDVLFFAQIRERLGISGLQVDFPEQPVTLAGLQQQLISEKGAVWADNLEGDNVLRAVNQQLAALDHQLKDGDEVAFFPPVTGG